MTPDEKLAAILAAVQTDPGNRGLARDPEDNLFTATKGDFQAACRSLSQTDVQVKFLTGFYIPAATPQTFETDGPLGTLFLIRALSYLNYRTYCESESIVIQSINYGMGADDSYQPCYECSHIIAIERGGPALDGRCYTMKGRDISNELSQLNDRFLEHRNLTTTIGIGDGGNEIGMGKIPHETIVKNIPNGDLIHCRVPTDHLIVAGVSNWGAYALAAGIFVLKGITPPDDLFDPDREREILEVMVKAGPLVDGVTGKQEATVDGLTWEEYVKPLVRIRDILAS